MASVMQPDGIDFKDPRADARIEQIETKVSKSSPKVHYNTISLD